MGEIGVEPPPELRVELLRAVDIRNRDDDYFELHVDSRDTRVSGVVTTDFILQICHVLSSYAFTKPIETTANARWFGE
jgi:hypothetical protein